MVFYSKCHFRVKIKGASKKKKIDDFGPNPLGVFLVSVHTLKKTGCQGVPRIRGALCNLLVFPTYINYILA